MNALAQWMPAFLALLGSLLVIAVAARLITRVVLTHIEAVKAGIRAETAEMRAGIEREAGERHAETQNQVAALRTETASFRSEMKGDLAALRGEIQGETGALRAEMKQGFADLRPAGAPETAPPRHRYDEIVAFLRSLDQPDDAAREYLEIHIPRIGRTLTLVPPPQSSKSVLELGAYMQMTPALQCVLGYEEVRGAYFGPLGRTEEKAVTAGGREAFRCLVDLFDAEKDRYPYPDGRFETVLACEIFEHMLHDPMHMLIEIRRLLEEAGTLILTTPNVASYLAVARVLEQSGNPQLYSKFPDPHGRFADTETPHVREYTPSELREAVESAGFEIEHLFTEVIPGYGTDHWVRDFLERNRYSASLRGEQLYCVARKRGGRRVVRYPRFLYDGC